MLTNITTKDGANKPTPQIIVPIMKHYALILLLGLLCADSIAQGLKPYTGRQADVLLNKKSDLIMSPTALSTYTGTQTQVQLPTGNSYRLATSSLAVDGFTSLSATGQPTKRWLLDVPGGEVDVVRYFGADNNASSDAAGAIQKAINFASAQNANGNTYRYTVVIPNGGYLVYKTIDCTERNGLTVRSKGGNYINCIVTGVTSATDATGSGIVFDCTGSTMLTIEGMTITSDVAWGNIASKTAVLFALGKTAGGVQTGGLRDVIRNCFMLMADIPTANGGLGSAGIINCRSEEFTARDCVIKANLPLLFTNSNSLIATGTSYAITSPYALVNDDGNGSMGVTNLSGMSLLGRQRRSPAIVLNGVNGFNFEGYMGREELNLGTAQTAVVAYQSCYGVKIAGTIETYQTVMEIAANCVLVNPTIKVTSANLNLPTSGRPEVMRMSGSASIRGGEIEVAFGNGEQEMSGRTFFYTPPVNGGDSPSGAAIANCRITADNWASNALFMSPALLHNSGNIECRTGQPFEKKGTAEITSTLSYGIPLGTVGAPGGAVFRFSAADKPTTSSGNGGVYVAKIEGIITGGGYSSGGRASLKIQGSVSVTQAGNGGYSGVAYVGIVGESTSNSPSYINISNFALGLSITSGIGTVTLTPTMTGTGTAEPVRFIGRMSILSDFAVNQSTIFQ